MTPTQVALASDSNPFYLDFWEPVSRQWAHACGIEPVLFFVGDPADAPPPAHGRVVVVPPEPGVPLHTQAQWARFFFPQREPDAVWITSDIDMFPLSPAYFREAARRYRDDAWVALNCEPGTHFPVCYNVARGRTMREALALPDDFAASLATLLAFASTPSHSVDGRARANWFADEAYASHRLAAFGSAHPGRVVRLGRLLGRSGSRRIDRADFRWSRVLLRMGWYLDCHSPRPYAAHRDAIESLLAASRR